MSQGPRRLLGPHMAKISPRGAVVPLRPKAGLREDPLCAHVAHTARVRVHTCARQRSWCRGGSRGLKTRLRAQWRVSARVTGSAMSQLQCVPLGPLRLGSEQARLLGLLGCSLSWHEPPTTHTHTPLGRGWASEASPANYLSLLGGRGTSGPQPPCEQPPLAAVKSPVIQGPGSQAGRACSHLKGERWRALLGVPFKFQRPEAGA